MNKIPVTASRTGAANPASAQDAPGQASAKTASVSSRLGKYRVSLVLVGLLALLKFVVVPAFDWQNDTLVRTHNAQRSLQKMQALLRHRSAIVGAERTLKAANKTLAGKIYPAATDAAFQLQQQVWLEKNATALKLRVKSIGWLAHIKLKHTRLTKRRAELRLSGSLAAMIRMLGRLQRQGAGISVEKYSWSSRRVGANKNSINGYFRLVFWSVSQ